MSPALRVVSPGEQSANLATPTRDPAAERGVGRAYRQEPNMLPQRAVAIRKQAPGMVPYRAWVAGPAVENRAGVIGRTGQMTIVARSGNSDPRAVGVSTQNWGTFGVARNFGAEPDTAPSQRNLYLIGGIAALAAVFLLTRKPAKG